MHFTYRKMDEIWKIRLPSRLHFVQLILTSLHQEFVNKAGERPHWKPLVWKGAARYISWKCFAEEEVKAVFQNSLTSLLFKKSFCGEQEVAAVATVTGASAIALAKAKATNGNISNVQQPTCEASLVVGEGQGRATREFELVWWPNIYTNKQRGKLICRYYVGKVMFTN